MNLPMVLVLTLGMYTKTYFFDRLMFIATGARKYSLWAMV
jgi:hypothetical protein